MGWKSVDISDEICFEDEFVEWLKSMTDKSTFKKFSKTREHILEHELVVCLEVYVDKNSSCPQYRIRIRGHNDDSEEGMTFEFYRMNNAQYRFGIEIENEIVTDTDGEQIDVKGKGYSRFMMGVMIYCLERHIDLPIDIKLPGNLLTIGICADASDGFWSNMGMKMGKYSMDGDRYNSLTGANAGYDLEFTLFDWKRWVFTSTKKGGFKKKPRTKKKIKRGKTKGKGTKGRGKTQRKRRKRGGSDEDDDMIAQEIGFPLPPIGHTISEPGSGSQSPYPSQLPRTSNASPQINEDIPPGGATGGGMGGGGDATPSPRIEMTAYASGGLASEKQGAWTRVSRPTTSAAEGQHPSQALQQQGDRRRVPKRKPPPVPKSAPPVPKSAPPVPDRKPPPVPERAPQGKREPPKKRPPSLPQGGGDGSRRKRTKRK